MLSAWILISACAGAPAPKNSPSRDRIRPRFVPKGADDSRTIIMASSLFSFF